MPNITKRLLEEFGISEQYIAYKIQCSGQSVKNWRNGVNPIPIYQRRLEKLLAEKVKKAEATKPPL